MTDLDYKNRGVPAEVALYAKEIYDGIRQHEDDYMPKAGFMSKQKDINEKMRAILIDWLIDVHSKFKLLNETLFLTVNLIDRYLSKCQVSRQNLQLIGVSCMFIATKYEEIYPPDLRDFVYVTDQAYTKQEILRMEGKVLNTLNFHVTVSSPYLFLMRYANLLGVSKKTLMMARYLTELALVEYGMIKYTPSNIAASALYLSCKIMKKTAWNSLMETNAKYSEKEVRPCAKALCIILQNTPKSNLKACKKKFSKEKFSEVAKIKIASQ